MGEISERREGRKRRDRGEEEEEGRVCDERENGKREGRNGGKTIVKRGEREERE